MGKIAQPLKAVTALTEDTGSLPSTLMVVNLSIIPVPRDLMASSGISCPGALIFGQKFLYLKLNKSNNLKTFKNNFY